MSATDLVMPPVNCRSCMLGRFTIYGTTVAETPDLVSTKRHEVKTVPAGRTFLHEGETQSSVSTLYSGWAFSYATLRDGRRQIFEFYIPGDILVLDTLAAGNVSLPFSVRSLTAVTLCAFEAKEAYALTRLNPDQQKNTEKTMRRHLAAIYRRMADLGRRSAVGRLAQLIMELEQRLLLRGLSRDGTFLFPPRQEHLADALGLTKVYVNRTLDRMRKEKILEIDRHIMTVLDRKRLSEIADEE